MSEPIETGSRRIGPGNRTYIIAEISANHRQSLDRAKRLVRAAKDAGADAVKFQTYTPDTMTIDCGEECFRITGGTPWDGDTLHDLYGRAHMPWSWQPILMEEARELDLDFFSTAFDPTSVDFLERIGVAIHKVASFEIVDLALIERMAATAKPLILSTGMATLEEIEQAVGTARAAGCRRIALMKCTSAYPAPPEEMNLLSIPDMMERFDLPVGLSDHTRGTTAAVAAVTLGASLVEKHFTLSRDDDGPDSAFSLDPAEFAEMVRAVRTAESARGAVRYGPTAHEESSLVFRRSLFVVEEIRAGEVFTRDNVRSIRPGDGLPPKHIDAILGRKSARRIPRGTPMSWDLVEGTDLPDERLP